MVGKAAYLERLYKNVRLWRSVRTGEKVEGSTPPSVFIGRVGYPKVAIGPLVPPVAGDTREMDFPEGWLPAGREAMDIAEFRLQLVRGKKVVDVRDQSRVTEQVREVALAEKPSEVEASLARAPTGGFFHEEVQPFGPSAPLKDFTANVARWDPQLERAYGDTDLLAKSAIIELYERDSPVSSIQRALSVGAFGLGRNRKLVPTRWSITAVDDTLGLHLLEDVRTFPALEEYRVYEYEALNNRFLVLFYPGLWRYESIEAFFPQIVGDRLEIFGDSEEFEGRRAYSGMGGCYYSARLASAERLHAEQRQAGVLILREVYDGYIPLGVWNVRECMRQALERPPLVFEDWPSALRHALSRLKLPLDTWLRHSKHLRERATQTSLKAYL
jgi:hypothetical protein